MARALDFWFDLSCPYAYLASTRVEALARRTGAELRPRPFLLGGVFKALGVPSNLAAAMPAPKARHNARDVHRWAALWEVPLHWPAGHPRRTVTALRAMLAAGEPLMPLAHRLFEAYWVRGLDVSRDEVVAGVLREAGLDAEAVLARAGSDAVKAELRRRTDEALAAGVFGAPACVVDGVLEWGQDRLDRVERALGGVPEEVPPAAALPTPADPWPADLWLDYGSPFAAVAAARAEALLGGAVRFRPLLLGAIFKAVGTPDVPLHAANPPKRRWLAADLERQAREAGLPLRWPSRFPMRTVLALRVTLLAGPDTAPGRRLVHALFRAGWCEDRDLADPQVVAGLATDAGLDGPALVAAAGEPAAKEALRAATDEALAAGVFGVPTVVVRPPGRPPALFWGNDRLPLATLAARGDARLL